MDSDNIGAFSWTGLLDGAAGVAKTAIDSQKKTPATAPQSALAKPHAPPSHAAAPWWKSPWLWGSAVGVVAIGLIAVLARKKR